MLYEVTVQSSYFGQNCINRFNYVSTGIPASVLGSFGLMKAMGFIPAGALYPDNTLFHKWRLLVSGNVGFQSVTVRAASLYAPEDFYERPFTVPISGIVGGESLSPMSAYGFRSTRSRLDIARGTKRFAGVAESYTDTGGVINTAGTPVAVALADALGAVLSYDDEGNIITYSPCIVSKQEYTTPQGKRAYRYYPTLDQQLDHVATGVLWERYTNVRSQTSRQYGRGS